MITGIIVFILVIALVYFETRRLYQDAKINNLPPGPWGFPIVGHLPLLGACPTKKFREWKKTYGPIFRLKFGSYDVVILNDAKIFKEAFLRDDMCGRVMNHNVLEMTGSRGIAFVHGPRPTEQRKFALKFLRDFDAGRSTRESRVQLEISDFINKLKSQCNKKDSMGKPIAFRVKKFFRFPIINSLWDILVGTKFEDGDPVLQQFIDAFEKFASCASNAFSSLLSFFNLPAKLFCIIGCNPIVNSMKAVYDYMAVLIEQERMNHIPGEPQNLTHAYFDEIAKTTDPESAFYEKRNESPVAIGDIFLGAIDTTSLTLDWFLLYIATEPVVQRKLQQEIDTVIGTDSSDVPSLTHKVRMPYTQAVIQELYRISSVVPLAVYHCTTQQVEFHGYTIPKDTIILPNLEGIHYDPEVWNEPNKFLPERFLGEDGSFISPHPIFPFGTGKRSCLGEGIARDQVFLFVTSLLKTFTVLCTENAPKLKPYCSYGFNTPHPFEVLFQERLPNRNQ